MSKTTYLFAIVFLALMLVSDLIQLGFWQQMGPEIVTMQSYLSWVTIASVTGLVAFSFLLRYFYQKGWKLVFLFALVGLILSIFISIIQYTRIVKVRWQPELFEQVVHICYALCIAIMGGGMASAAEKNETGLKWAGILTALSSLSLLLLSGSTVVGRSVPLADRIILYVHLVSDTALLLLIWTFAREMRKLSFPAEHSNFQKNALLVSGTISVILIAFQFGAAVEVATQIGWSTEWKKKGLIYLQSLALKLENRNFIGTSGDTLRYFLMKPLNYDPAFRYPIVTCLNGGAIANGDKVEIQEPVQFLMDSPNRKNFPAFIFVPQVSAGRSWGHIPGVRGMDSLVFGALAALQMEFSVDPDRYYITGGSGGGYGTWDYVSRRPELFAAAIPMCGGGNPATAARIAHIPIWAFHGEVDRNVSVSGSRNMIAAIRAAGGEPKYSEFRDVGHNVWPEVQKTPGVLDWLFAQRRKKGKTSKN